MFAFYFLFYVFLLFNTDLFSTASVFVAQYVQHSTQHSDLLYFTAHNVAGIAYVSWEYVYVTYAYSMCVVQFNGGSCVPSCKNCVTNFSGKTGKARTAMLAVTGLGMPCGPTFVSTGAHPHII